MRVAELIDVSGGIISIIGSGGKTTLMRTLAGQLPGTVILTTTTHIYPLDGLPLVTANNPAVIQRALQQNRVISIGTPGRNGKLTAPALSFDQLRQMARWVLVEADGSRRLPLKAHAPYEPVIPMDNSGTIWVIGASGFGKPVSETVHRPELYCRITGSCPDDLVTPEMAAAAVTAENLAAVIYLNQVETENDWKNARIFAAALKKTGMTVAAGSLYHHTCEILNHPSR